MTQTRKKKKHHTSKRRKDFGARPDMLQWWQKIFLFAIAVSIVEFVVSVFVEYSHRLEEMIHVFHLVVIMMIITDLVFEYIQADEKKDFLKKHWIEIIAIFPWGAVGRGARLTEMASEGARVTRAGLEARRIHRQAKDKMHVTGATKSRRSGRRAAKKKSSRRSMR